MTTALRLAGMCLISTSLFFCAEKGNGSELLEFTLDETSADVVKKFGPATLVADAGPEYFSWSYRKGVEDEHEFSHILLFRKNDRKLVSVTRVFEHPVTASSFFAATKPSTCWFPNAKEKQWPVLLSKQTARSMLIAMGAATPGDQTTQVVLISPTAVRVFMPWLTDQFPLE